MHKPVHYQKELHALLDRMDGRLDVLRQFGLKLWTGVLRSSLADLGRSRREHAKQVAGELMQLESEIRAMEKDLPAQQLDGVLNRIAKLKALLLVLFLGLVGWTAVDLANESMLRPRSVRRAGIRKVMRGRRRDEMEGFVA